MNKEINISNSISTKIIIIFVLMLGTSLGIKAQEQNLPLGQSTIYLLSGKTVSKVEIRKIDSLKIEYIKDGNLADIKTENVSMIIFSEGTIKTLNDSKKINTKINNVELKKQEIARRLHFSIGFGNNISAENIFSDLSSTDYHQMNYYNNTLSENPMMASSAQIALGFEYSINHKWKAGISVQSYDAFIEGAKGTPGSIYQNISEMISGKGYCFSANHFVYELIKPIRISVSAGGSLMYNKVNLIAAFIAYDTTNATSLYSNYDTQCSSINDIRESFGLELFGTAELYVWKSFSIFLKPSYTFDQGFIIPEQTFTFPTNKAYYPEQKINFSGFGLQWGLAFHFLNFKKGKNTYL